MEYEKVVTELNSQLETLLNMTNNAFAKLSEQDYEKVREYQIDANKIVDLYKKGKFDEAQKLIDKYAGNSRK